MTGLILTVSKLLLIIDTSLYYARGRKDLKTVLIRLGLIVIGIVIFGINGTMSFLIFILAVAFLKGGGWREVLAVSGIMLGFFCILFLTGKIELLTTTHGNSQSYQDYGFEIEWLQFVILTIIFCLTKATNIEKYGSFSKKLSKAEITNLSVFILSLGAFAPFYHFGIDTNTWTIESIIVLLCRSAFFTLLSWLLFKAFSDRQVQWKYMHMNRELLEQQEAYYEALLVKEKENQKLRHDLRSHFLAITYLLKNEDYNQALSYISDINENFWVQNIEITNIPILNVILKDLFDRYQLSLNLLTFKGQFPTTAELNDMDNVVLFTNLFKNALEATTEVAPEEQAISFSIEELPQGLLIKMANPLVDTVEFKNGVPISKLKNNHKGLGTKNIQTIIDKYHGKISYEVKGNIFKTSIFLPNLEK
ncbi:hypothetical protein FACS1894193_08350 [Bacilli bacterium]|nr:hypothetical protein FACS1894193_08350 [Bacilli bacterium]